jgi:ABC-type branched-subunit amino acid transport system substrate-binding protein
VNADGGIKHRALQLRGLNDGGNLATATNNATALTTGATPAFALMASSSQTVSALESAGRGHCRAMISNAKFLYY